MCACASPPFSFQLCLMHTQSTICTSKHHSFYNPQACHPPSRCSRSASCSCWPSSCGGNSFLIITYFSCALSSSSLSSMGHSYVPLVNNVWEQRCSALFFCCWRYFKFWKEHSFQLEATLLSHARLLMTCVGNTHSARSSTLKKQTDRKLMICKVRIKGSQP